MGFSFNQILCETDGEMLDSRGYKESEMGLWDSDEEEDETGEGFEEYHVTGGLSALLPGSKSNWFGEFFLSFSQHSRPNLWLWVIN